MTQLDHLKTKVAGFPAQPGVYVMKDFDGVIIYIGKAKNLRARVRNYLGATDGRFQIQYLIRRVQTIDHIITETEEEAFLLERDLINKHKPRYNIRLKDDKSYLSVRVDRNLAFPRLELVRHITPDGAEYYGPFPNSGALYEVLEVIKKVSPLRTCSDSVFANRVRPCLEYEIKRCAAPCKLAVDRAQYEEWLAQAIDILQGKIDPTIGALSERMESAAESLRFEEAAALRDRIDALERFKNRGRESVSYDFTCDVFGLYREEDLGVVSILKTRNGRISQVESYDFRDIVMTDAELMSSVIEQYYAHGRDIPQEIVLPFDIGDERFIGNLLTNEFGSPVSFLIPTYGPKHRLVRICEINAKQHFTAKFFSEARFDEISQELAKRFKLNQLPRSIECFDISNFQGSDIVGALVSFQDGAPYYKGYRRFKVSFQDKPNDFEAMYECVKRRLSRDEKLPDLIIIDGGRQQLARACQARDELGLTVDIISIAKMRIEKHGTDQAPSHKPERIFLEGADDSIALDPADPVTHFVQRMRDEVHGYVLRYHRAKRKARVFRSVLDDISGVGPERRKRLLTHFGSVEAIASSDIHEVAKIGRMPASLAQKVLSVLQSKQ